MAQNINAERVKRSIGLPKEPEAPKSRPGATKYRDGVVAYKGVALLPEGWWPQHTGVYVDGRQVGCAWQASIASGEAERVMRVEDLVFAELPIGECLSCRPRIVVGGPK